MAVFQTQHRTFICDRCAYSEDRRGTEPAPDSWLVVRREILRGSTTRETLLCRRCATELVIFLAGRDLDP